MKKALVDVITSGHVDQVVDVFDYSGQSQNQLLFFVKPEVFLLPTPSNIMHVCDMIFAKLAEYGVSTSGAYMISGGTLERLKLMDSHYGYINLMSRQASALLTSDDRKRIEEGLGADVRVFGGHEVLARHPALGADELNTIWSGKKSLKLRSGLYFQQFDVESERIGIVNGFHPSQLRHFTASDRRLLLVLLNTDLPWRVLRYRLLGDTFPERAHPSSIRGKLFSQARDFGYDSVSIANNSVHLSAGPFEAAFECQNFLSRLDPTFSLTKTRLYTQFLKTAVSPERLEGALRNPSVVIDGDSTETKLFDITEECDAAAAVALFKQFF